MFYFLAFLLLASVFAFGGLPLPGTLRMASSADSGYIASLVRGLIFAVCNRLWAVSYEMPRASANSCIVNPFTFINQLSAVKNQILSKVYIFSTQTLSINNKKLQNISKCWIINIDNII